MPIVAYRPYYSASPIFSSRYRARRELAISLGIGALFSLLMWI
jgi:hypothetical protein